MRLLICLLGIGAFVLLALYWSGSGRGPEGLEYGGVVSPEVPVGLTPVEAKPPGAPEQTRAPVPTRAKLAIPTRGSLRVQLSTAALLTFPKLPSSSLEKTLRKPMHALQLVLEAQDEKSGRSPQVPQPGEGPGAFLWVDLEPGSYALRAIISGSLGSRQVLLQDLIVEDSRECSDPRLFPWNPYHDVSLMVLQLGTEDGDMPGSLELGLALEHRRESVQPADNWPLYSVVEPLEKGARVLISAIGYRDVSLRFEPGLHEILLRRRILPTFHWADENGIPLVMGSVTIERVEDPEKRFEPFSIKFSLYAAASMAPKYRPLLPMPSLGLYRVTEESGDFEPAEFEVLDRKDPDIDVVLRRVR